jgi:hypothetical protein
MTPTRLTTPRLIGDGMSDDDLEARVALLGIVVRGFLVQNLRAKPRPLEALQALREEWAPLVRRGTPEFAAAVADMLNGIEQTLRMNERRKN